ncbi:MAG: nucleotidyltransferase domain-containing protein [Candidatus Bathyarchaeia archaeon]
MLEKLLIKEAKRREETFKNLPSYLRNLISFLKEMDRKCKIFLFGSVVKGDYALISDIDILIKTKLKPKEVIAKLRNAGFDEPFEFHVVNEKEFKVYKLFIPELKEISTND